MRSGSADADGVRIRYDDHGTDAPALVLVHATGFCRRVWDPWLDALTPRFRVVAIDQRGHGDSDKPETDYRWEAFGVDVLAVTDELGLDTPAGMGHSAGAAALILAEAARPGTFSRLVLMDPVLAPPEVRELARQGPNPLAEGARRRRRDWASPDELVTRLRERSPLSAWRDEFLRAYANGCTSPQDGGVTLDCPPQIEAQVYEMGMRHAGWELLQGIGCPVVLLCGKTSELWGEANRERMPVRTEVIEGGHFFPMENPDATLERALAFLTEEDE